MKKIVCVILAVILMAALCACNRPAHAPAHTQPTVETAQPIADEDLILVQPDDVVVKEAGSCVFTAIHREFLDGTWHFVTPGGDMDVVSSSLNIYLPSVGVYCDNVSEMLLINIATQLDGCSVYCEFDDGTRTRNATIRIDPYL